MHLYANVRYRLPLGAWSARGYGYCVRRNIAVGTDNTVPQTRHCRTYRRSSSLVPTAHKDQPAPEDGTAFIRMVNAMRASIMRPIQRLCKLVRGTGSSGVRPSVPAPKWACDVSVGARRGGRFSAACGRSSGRIRGAHLPGTHPSGRPYRNWSCAGLRHRPMGRSAFPRRTVRTSRGPPIRDIPVAGLWWGLFKLATRSETRLPALTGRALTEVTLLQRFDASPPQCRTRLRSCLRRRTASVSANSGWSPCGSARGLGQRLGPGDRPVATLLGHTTGAIAALLGITRSGRPFMNLDPSLPDQRLGQMQRLGLAEACLVTHATSERADACRFDIDPIDIRELVGAAQRRRRDVSAIVPGGPRASCLPPDPRASRRGSSGPRER